MADFNAAKGECSSPVQAGKKKLTIIRIFEMCSVQAYARLGIAYKYVAAVGFCIFILCSLGVCEKVELNFVMLKRRTALRLVCFEA